MFPILAGFLILLQAPQKLPDRATFLNELSRLPDRAPVSDVLKALGKPDRIERHDFTYNEKPTFSETWLYGTDGPKGAATLAQFEISEGKLSYHPVGAKPPPASVISELELRKGMHIVLDALPQQTFGKTNTAISAWVVKVVNTLLPLGEAKCKAIVGECGRVMEGHAQLDPCPYFLCYSLFDPPKKPGYFDVFGPVWSAETPKDHLAHPRWPVEIIGNVPIIRGEPMGGFGGYAPAFETEYLQLVNRIHLRKSPLSAPTVSVR